MTEQMKAAYINEVGPAKNIIFGTLPKPSIGSRQVLVRVKAVAVDHLDTYIRSGAYQQPGHFPYILGQDLCGVVEKVGTDATKFKVGQKVWTTSGGLEGRQGTFSEYAVVNENLLHALPDGVDEKEAAAVINAATTALIGLIRIAKLRREETIFVNGAAGNVGSAVVAFAHLREAKVIAATSGKDKENWCKEIGADHVIDYKSSNIAQQIKQIAPDGIDVYWDASKKPDLETAVDVIAQRGRIVLMAGADAKATLPIGQFYRKEASILGFTLTLAEPVELNGYADIINRALQDKKLKAHIAKVLPLSDVAAAHEILENDKELWGKIVLTV
jgi:NADPH2:quinone reductase